MPGLCEGCGGFNIWKLRGNFFGYFSIGITIISVSNYGKQCGYWDFDNLHSGGINRRDYCGEANRKQKISMGDDKWSCLFSYTIFVISSIKAECEPFRE